MLSLVIRVTIYSASTRQMNKENAWRQKLQDCKEGARVNNHLSREFSGVTFRSADTLLLLRNFFLRSCNARLFSVENHTFKAASRRNFSVNGSKRPHARSSVQNIGSNPV